jgi:hypothetical protein
MLTPDLLGSDHFRFGNSVGHAWLQKALATILDRVPAGEIAAAM